MPRKLKRLSGAEVVNIMRTFNFALHSQKGSHVKLRRISAAGEKETLTIPLHDEARKRSISPFLLRLNNKRFTTYKLAVQGRTTSIEPVHNSWPQCLEIRKSIICI